MPLIQDAVVLLHTTVPGTAGIYQSFEYAGSLFDDSGGYLWGLLQWALIVRAVCSLRHATRGVGAASARSNRQLKEALAQSEGRQDGPLGVVLLGEGSAKHRQEMRVRHLLDGPTILEDFLLSEGREGVHLARQHLKIY